MDHTTGTTKHTTTSNQAWADPAAVHPHSSDTDAANVAGTAIVPQVGVTESGDSGDSAGVSVSVSVSGAAAHSEEPTPITTTEAGEPEASHSRADDYPHSCDYSFSVDDLRWKEFLSMHGYVVVRGVATRDNVLHARSLYWSYFEKSMPALNRLDPSTWSALSLPRHGIIFGGTRFGNRCIQSAGAWYLRGLVSLRRVFEQIWETEDLIVSMDSPIVWRPWWLDARWTPVTEGLHVDQNPVHKPSKDCIQGMIPLYHVTEETGGLEVIPETHLDSARLAFLSAYPDLHTYGNFITLRKTDALQGKGKLLLANAGDLILWDSRTVHGGRVGTGKRQSESLPEAVELVRLSQTVCMVPRSKATENVLQRRIEGFEKGSGFNHCPHEANASGAIYTASAPYEPIELTAAQRSLL